MAQPDVSALRSLLDSAHHITILLPKQAEFDLVSASLGLKISLESSGKQARVVCPDPITVEFNRLVGVDEITNSLGSRNLVISFPGQTQHVDKVSYNLEKGDLQLVISPKLNSPELDHKQLKFVSGIPHTDLILTLGVLKLADLGSVFDQLKDQLPTATLVSLSHIAPSEKFSTHEIHDYDASSLSELATHVIELLSLKLEQDAASNLLAGLEKATDNFRHPTVSVKTFEAATILMRKGAKRHFEISASQFPAGSIPASPDQPVRQGTVVDPGLTYPSAQSGYGTDSSGGNAEPIKHDHQKPPADWYEPKIFKGPMQP